MSWLKQIGVGLICILFTLQLSNVLSSCEIISYSTSKVKSSFKSKETVNSQKYFVSCCFEDDTNEGDDQYNHSTASQNDLEYFSFWDLKEAHRLVDSSLVLEFKRVPCWLKYRQIIR